ncbi:hypothetical protein C8J57DRAFT_1529386 [Mycena rebaudengoi]|nr:hypothetical protein C8J57DRAFT_1529386 [Mycena rebaudengoi]
MWNEVQATNSLSLFTTSASTGGRPPTAPARASPQANAPSPAALSPRNQQHPNPLSAAHAPEDSPATSSSSTCSAAATDVLQAIAGKPLCTTALPRRIHRARRIRAAATQHAARTSPPLTSPYPSSSLRAPPPTLFPPPTALSLPIPRAGTPTPLSAEEGKSSPLLASPAWCPSYAPCPPTSLPRFRVLVLTHWFPYLPLAPPPADLAFFAAGGGTGGEHTIFRRIKRLPIRVASADRAPDRGVIEIRELCAEIKPLRCMGALFLRFFVPRFDIMLRLDA